MSLTARLIWFFSAITLSILLVLGWILAQAVEHHFEEMDLAELTTKHQQISQLSNQADFQQLRQELEYLIPLQAGWHFVVFDKAYNNYYSSHPELSNTSWNDFIQNNLFDLALAGEAYRGLAQDSSNKSSIENWHFLILMSIEHHNKFMDYFIKILWISLVLALVLMTSIGWIVIRKALSPLNKMNKLAAKVSGQNLSERLNPQSLPKEIQELAKVFNAMLDRLETSFNRLSQFSNDLAHELRNPINSLMIQNQVALSKTRSPQDYQEVLASNLEDFERLTRMVNDMLLLAQAEQNNQLAQKETINLATKITNLLDFYQLVASEKNIELKLTGQADVVGDAAMLERALANLLTNAVHYADEASTISINLAESNKQAIISITNQGETIGKKHWPHLFNRFYRADAARHYIDGAGLGLAITRSIVESHKGHIEFISKDRQTTFIIHLPTTPLPVQD